jgi:hypothetical protein
MSKESLQEKNVPFPIHLLCDFLRGNSEAILFTFFDDAVL